MLQREQLDRFKAAVSRLVALIDHHELVRKVRTDWAMFDHTANAFEDQVERVKDTLAEVERDG